MIKFFKKLLWLVKNQEKIDSLINKKSSDKNYSLVGVPEYQQQYVTDILEDDNK